MTARLFSYLEPVSNPDDPARAIAAFFFVVAGVGAAPGLYGLICMTIAALASAAELSPLGILGSLAAVLFILLGFAQALFYFRRAVDRGGGRRARRWWLSTYFYNLVPLGLSIAALVDEQELVLLAPTLWFAVLCALALVARGGDAIGPRDRGQRVTR